VNPSLFGEMRFYRSSSPCGISLTRMYCGFGTTHSDIARSVFLSRTWRTSPDMCCTDRRILGARTRFYADRHQQQRNNLPRNKFTLSMILNQTLSLSRASIWASGTLESSNTTSKLLARVLVKQKVVSRKTRFWSTHAATNHEYLGTEEIRSSKVWLKLIATWVAS
jgi:hypothetical protein